MTNLMRAEQTIAREAHDQHCLLKAGVITMIKTGEGAGRAGLGGEDQCYSSKTNYFYQ